MLEQNWNRGWRFWRNLDSFNLAWTGPEDAVTVNLPHDAMLLEQPYAGSPNGGKTGYRDGGVYCYEKALYLPWEDRGRSFFLKFEGVYMNAMVYVNGMLVCRRPYGFSTFYAALNSALRFGQDNYIRVVVRNAAPLSCRWYSGGGIYRDVYLLSGGSVYLVPDSLQAETKSVDEGGADVECRVVLKNTEQFPRNVLLRLTVTTPDGAASIQREVPLPVFPGQEHMVRQRFLLTKPELWEELHPALYHLRAEILEDGVPLDEGETSFGIRTLTLDAQRGLRVNGKSVKLRGACIHQDNGLLGAAACRQAEYRRVRRLKEAGFNAIRMSHHPMSPAMLRACDVLGVYVIDEAFDMWTRGKGDNDYALYFQEWWERDVEAMAAKDYNHPCVIIYSLGNEIPEIATEQGVDVLRRMVEKVKEMDSGRFTTIAVNCLFTVADQLAEIAGDVTAQKEGRALDGSVNDVMTAIHSYLDDVVRHPIVSQALRAPAGAVDLMGYNYMTARYEQDRLECPDRVIVGSETYPPDIGRNWEAVKRIASVIGDFTWTGWDYIGEAGVGVPAYRRGEGGFGAKFPCQLAYCGDIDITGYRRPASYYREIVFGLRKEPYITVQDPNHYGEKLIKTPWVMSDSQARWNWPECEGKPVVIEVYSAAPEVELFQNGVSLGRKPCGSAHNFTAYFETFYMPGVLEAVDRCQGQETARCQLVSAGEPELHIAEEPSGPEEFFSGLHYYAIEQLDGAGNLRMDQELQIEVNVENGVLMGFGGAGPKPEYMYTSHISHTFHGRAQAIVYSEGRPTITVTAIGP